MSMPCSAGTGVSPATLAAFSWLGAHSTRTSCPADCNAHPSGTIGNQCAGHDETAKSIRMSASVLRMQVIPGHAAFGDLPLPVLADQPVGADAGQVQPR